MTAADRIKETVVSWRRMTVITEQLTHPTALRPIIVYVANEAGERTSLTAAFATSAAADLEHQKLVRQLSTGERNSACT